MSKFELHHAWLLMLIGLVSLAVYWYDLPRISILIIIGLSLYMSTPIDGNKDRESLD